MPKNRHSNARDEILNIFFCRGQKLFMASVERNTCSSDIPMHLRDVATVFPYTWHEILYKYVPDISPSLPPRQNRLKTSQFKSSSRVLFFSMRLMFIPARLLLCLLPSPSSLAFCTFTQLRNLASDLTAQCHYAAFIVQFVVPQKTHCSLLCSP